MTAPTTDSAGIRQVIRALRKSGHVLYSVNDGEEETKVSTETAAVEAIMAVDMAHLHVTLPGGNGAGWVFFVLGNAPDEVVSDYTLNLDPTIDNLIRTWW